MKLLSILLLVALTGCQFTVAQRSAFDKTCAAGRTAYTVFSTLKETGRFSASTVQRVDAAWAGANSLCVNPPPDVQTAAVQVAAALVIISKALDT